MGLKFSKDCFDYEYYRFHNKDVFNVFGSDNPRIWQHWQRYGCKEGRPHRFIVYLNSGQDPDCPQQAITLTQSDINNSDRIQQLLEKYGVDRFSDNSYENSQGKSRKHLPSSLNKQFLDLQRRCRASIPKESRKKKATTNSNNACLLTAQRRHSAISRKHVSTLPKLRQPLPQDYTRTNSVSEEITFPVSHSLRSSHEKRIESEVSTETTLELIKNDIKRQQIREVLKKHDCTERDIVDIFSENRNF